MTQLSGHKLGLVHTFAHVMVSQLSVKFAGNCNRASFLIFYNPQSRYVRTIY